MKRLLYTIACTLVCTFCGPYVHDAVAQSPEAEQRHLSHEERIARRAERLAALSAEIDSLVLSHNFEFNPQSVQVQPAGQMHMFANANFVTTLWRGTLDICLPYYAGMMPPYRYVVINQVVPYLRDYLTVQTHDGWNVSFKATLNDGNDYTFLYNIYSHGGATLTISNTWYSPVQYTGTITKVY